MAGAGSERRRIFAREVFAGAGRAAAAMAAGYHGNERTLVVSANRLMRHPEVKSELAKLEEMARVKAVATREEALELLTRQLRFSPKALLTPGGTVDLAAAVDSGAIELLEGVEVADTESGQRIRVKFPDRQAAVDRLAKLLGWNKPEQHEIKHVDGLRAVLASMTDEELGVTGTEPSAGGDPDECREDAAAEEPKRPRKRPKRKPARCEVQTEPAPPAPSPPPSL